MKKIIFAIILFGGAWQADATSFFIDFQCGDVAGSCGNGLSTTSPFSSIDEFADVARNAGDIAFVRRGKASTTNISDIVFTSDGTLNNPITITADYDNLWNDFATSTVTWTPTFGSKFIASSASSSGFATPNTWIYLASDCYENSFRTIAASSTNPCEYAYEVQAASSTGIQLFLPYEGMQSGSGKNMRLMPSAPQWNTTTGDFQWAMSQDFGWYFKGIDIRSTDPSCGLQINTGSQIVGMDLVLQTNGTTACSVAPGNYSYLTKIRSFGGDFFAGVPSTIGFIISDFLVDCNSVANTRYFTSSADINSIYSQNGIIQNCTQVINITGAVGAVSSNGQFYFKNVATNNTYLGITGGPLINIFFENNFKIIGLNSQISNQISAAAISTTTVSSTANLRSGGGPNNLLIFPPAGNGNTGISTKNFPVSYLKLFEYPIYTDTTSKTYTMYFNSTSTSDWITNPLTGLTQGSSTPEMFIECEMYKAVSGADRMLVRSTTTAAITFASATTWQGISVTCQPSQSGILYLRGWYGKPKEINKTNWFYMDTTPVITTP